MRTEDNDGQLNEHFELPSEIREAFWLAGTKIVAAITEEQATELYPYYDRRNIGDALRIKVESSIRYAFRNVKGGTTGKARNAFVIDLIDYDGQAIRLFLRKGRQATTRVTLPKGAKLPGNNTSPVPIPLPGFDGVPIRRIMVVIYVANKEETVARFSINEQRGGSVIQHDMVDLTPAIIAFPSPTIDIPDLEFELDFTAHDDNGSIEGDDFSANSIEDTGINDTDGTNDADGDLGIGDHDVG